MGSKPKDTYKSVARYKLVTHIETLWESQKRFADEMEINKTMLHDFLTGKREPNLKRATQILYLTESKGKRHAIRPEEWTIADELGRD